MTRDGEMEPAYRLAVATGSLAPNVCYSRSDTIMIRDNWEKRKIVQAVLVNFAGVTIRQRVHRSSYILLVLLLQSGFGKAQKEVFTDEEQAAKREERNEALSAQRDKVSFYFLPSA